MFKSWLHHPNKTSLHASKLPREVFKTQRYNHLPMSLSYVLLSKSSWIQYFSTLKICSLLEFSLRNVLPKITSSFSTLIKFTSLKKWKQRQKKNISHAKRPLNFMISLRVLLVNTARNSLLIEAVRCRQHPAGVDQNPTALVMVLPMSRLVHVDESLPRLLSDVAHPTPKHAVHWPV